MKWLQSYLQNAFNLFYPVLCAACNEPLMRGENIICTDCHFHLPRTNFHLQKNNPVEQHFWGRVKVFRAASFFYFQKGSRVQHLLHALKYEGNKEAGVFIGDWYGHELSQSEEFRSVDMIVAVPLHKSKERERTYNQSDLFCEGLSHSMKKPWIKNGLIRQIATETQTHKSRLDRWKNVEDVFELNDPLAFEGKHVLLTDDVITTGSTLEACARKLLSSAKEVSIATIACTM